MDRRLKNFITRWLEFKDIDSLPYGPEYLHLQEKIYLNTTPGRKKVIQVRIEEFWKHQAINLDDISWLSHKNERQCNWVWGKLYLDYSHDDERLYNPPTFLFDNCAYNSKERYSAIIDFFDYRNISMGKKMIEIMRLKQEWNINQSNRNSFDWYDQDNKEQCIWIWRYIEKVKASHAIKLITAPRNHIEMYYDSILIFDLYPDIFNSETIKSIRNGWAQQKSRNLKKASNTIPQETLNKIIKTARKMNVSPKKLIESWICREY